MGEHTVKCSCRPDSFAAGKNAQCTLSYYLTTPDLILVFDWISLPKDESYSKEAMGMHRMHELGKEVAFLLGLDSPETYLTNCFNLSVRASWDLSSKHPRGLTSRTSSRSREEPNEMNKIFSKGRMFLQFRCFGSYVQGYSYNQLIGWVDLDFGSSPGWWPTL